MNYPECQKETINLESIGANRPIAIRELVKEVISNRRREFFDELFHMRDGEVSYNYCFDAITFKAAMEDFTKYYDCNLHHSNYEGTMEYEIVAGNDWVWNCRTTITWKSTLPIAFGMLEFHTEILSTSSNVKEERLNGMTGTSMEITMKKSDLLVLNLDEIADRDAISLG